MIGIRQGGPWSLTRSSYSDSCCTSFFCLVKNQFWQVLVTGSLLLPFLDDIALLDKHRSIRRRVCLVSLVARLYLGLSCWFVALKGHSHHEACNPTLARSVLTFAWQAFRPQSLSCTSRTPCCHAAFWLSSLGQCIQTLNGFGSSTRCKSVSLACRQTFYGASMWSLQIGCSFLPCQCWPWIAPNLW